MLGIEILDVRYKNWFLNFILLDLILDNIVIGFVVVGDFVDGFDNDVFVNVYLNLYKDNKCIVIGELFEVFGNFLNVIYWLIKKLYMYGK